MEVDCAGCAGCCVDWRALAPDVDHGDEHDPPRRPVDDLGGFVSLTRGDVRAFLGAGLADALTARLFHAGDADDSLTLDGVDVAAVDGRPAFLVGLRQPPKPVAPFGVEPTWLPTCAFLDPETLQCRIHDAPEYPETCATFPGHDLAVDAETECERVEATFGGERLLDDEPPDDLPDFGPWAVGWKVFAHPDPGKLAGAVAALDGDGLDDEHRAEFVAAAAASAPGTIAVDHERYERARERALAAESWVGRAIDDWRDRERAGTAPDPAVAGEVEGERDAPPTPGWE